MASRYFVSLLVAAAGVAGACTRVEVAEPSPGVSLGDGGAAGESAGGAGPVAGGGGEGGADEYVGAGGEPGSIELGIWPTFAADPSESRDVQAVLASVSALSRGSRTLPLAERWDQLSGATGSPRASTWNRLDAMSQPYRERGNGVALCIGIVDREQPAWPFSGTLDGDAALAAIERTIDEVYTRYGEQLSHLCFGYELDRYLALASNDERRSLLALLTHAVDYASHHAHRSRKTAIGTALSLQGLADPEADTAELALGDEVVGVYDVLDDAAALKPPEAVVDEVTAALAALAAAPGQRRLLTLFEVGYPSGTDAGSSQKQQRSYYEALFGLLDTRRDAIGFVGIYGLGDRAAADCEAEALAFGGSTDADVAAAWASARCSMGLRAEPAETDKLVWPDIAAVLSRFR
ncbi:MAG: hypothetical protein ABUL60_01085 [Myxococcales bacterium]